MPRVAAALLLALVASFSAGAAGHDVSSVRYGPSGQWLSPSAVAFNGSHFLTVWSMGGYAFGALTDRASEASLPPFVLPGVTGLEEPLVIPWGSGFLSVWKTWDYFQIVTLDEHGVIERVSRVSVAWRYQSWRIATNGRQLLIVDVESVFASTGYASLYEPDGTLLARTELPAAGVYHVAVARSSDGYVVVTGGLSGVHFFRIDDAGAIVAEKELHGVRQPYPPRTSDVAVAVAGTQAMVAWTATDSTSASATTISSSNEVGALQPLPIAYAYPAIRAVPAASGCLILWSEAGHVSLVRMSAAGQIIDEEALQVAAGDLQDATGAGGDRFAAITSPASLSSPVSIVIGTLLPQRVRTSFPSVVTSTAARQEQPVIASDGVDYVSAWMEHDGPDVMAKIGRVTRTGIPLDGPGIALPVPTKSVSNVSIARGAGGDALVVVSAPEGTWAFRWSRAVGLLDTAPISLDARGTQYGSAVAWNGVSYLVVWVDGYSYGLAGRFVGGDGRAGAKVIIPMTIDKQEFVEARNPAVAWDGRQFLISIPTAYEYPCPSLCGPPTAEEIRLVRLSAEGSLLDKTPYRVLNTSSARVATSGNEFLLLTSYFDSFSAVVVHASASGLSVSEPVLPTVFSIAPDVTWDGTYYDIPWPGAGGWFHLWRLDRRGNLAQKLFAAVSHSHAPSVTANDAGEVAIGIAEEAPPSGLSRARIYFGTELESVQPVLTVPTNAVSHIASPPGAYSGLTCCYATVTWDGDAPGFVVEEASPPYWYLLQRLPGDVHEATVYTKVGAVIRIRAVGPDDITPDGAITTIRSEPRTRTVRR